MLTDTEIRNARPEEKTRRLYDSRGLYLETTPKSGKGRRLKYWINRKEKRISLGVYPDVGLKEARECRDEARKLIADGIDPSQQRKAKKLAAEGKVANSFEGVAREWFGRATLPTGPRAILKLSSDALTEIFSLGSDIDRLLKSLPLNC